MNYNEAARTRRTGLLSLIAEKKFQDGQSLGSSIGGAISDKFKAKAVGFKEKFDPLNMIRGVVGKGVIGKSLVTLAGRAMGKDEDDIRHFGGYGSRKRKLYETLSKRDPLISTIGPGAVVNIRPGDTAANIMAKTYNFMEKTHETYKRNYELDELFRKEQYDEDERRHKKLIDALLDRKEPAKEEEKDDSKSFIQKLLEGLKKTLAFILEPFKIIFTLLKDISLLIGTAVLSSLASLTTFLVGSILSIVSPAIALLAELSVKRAISGIASKIPIPWLGNAIAAGAAIWFGNEALDLDKKLIGNLVPSDVLKESEVGSKSEYDKARDINNKTDQGPAKVTTQRKFDEEKKKLQDRMDDNFKKEIEPILKAAGYTVDYEYRDNHLGLANGLDLPTIYDKNRRQVYPEGIALIVAGVKQTEGVLETLKGDTEAIKKILKVPDLQEQIHQKVEAAGSKVNSLLKSDNSSKVKSIPPLIETDANGIASNEQVVSVVNTQNNIGGGAPKMVDTGTTALRNGEINNLVYVV